jgi:hypothetical protein
MSAVLTLQIMRLLTQALPKNKQRIHTGNYEAFDTGRALIYSSGNVKSLATTLQMIIHDETHFFKILKLK